MPNGRFRSAACSQTASSSSSFSGSKVFTLKSGNWVGPHKATCVPSLHHCLLGPTTPSKLKLSAAAVSSWSTTGHYRCVLSSSSSKTSGEHIRLERASWQHVATRTATPVQQSTTATAAAPHGNIQREGEPAKQRQQQRQQQLQQPPEKAHMQQQSQRMAGFPVNVNKPKRHWQMREQKQQVLSEAQQLRQHLRHLQHGQSQQHHDPAGFRAAAAGSTALLLSWLQSALLQLQQPPTAPATTETPPGTSPADVPTGRAGAPSHTLQVRGWLAALTDVLITISWHCKTHDLLPNEALQLQRLLLLQLLPLLGPHLKRLRPKLLARVVFALGSCHASLELINGDNSSSSSSTQYSSSSGTFAAADGAARYQPGLAGQAAAAAAAAAELEQLTRTGDHPATQSLNSDSSRTTAQQEQLQRDHPEQQHTWKADSDVQSSAQAESESAHQQQQQQYHRQDHPAAIVHGQDSSNERHHPQQQQQQRRRQRRRRQQRTSGQQCWRNLGSDEWVQVLLPLLVPQQLSTGALLATWQGCALHQLTPPQQWLQAASTAAYHALQLHKLDHSDTAALLQSCAQLGYSPPSWLMHELVRHLQQHLAFFTPSHLAGVLSGLQVLSFRPSNTFLRCWCESSSRLMADMTISQLAAAAAALSWAGYQLQPWWTLKFLTACQPLLPTADAEELLLLLHASLGMRPPPPQGWLHECYCHLRAQQQQLTLSQVADAAHVLATLQLPSSFMAHHRRWLAACLRELGLRRLTTAAGSTFSSGSGISGESGGSNSASSFSRSELLYTLYAAGKLQVAPEGGWLAAALQQLHQLLPGAGPAELVASFVVFAHFRSSNRERQQQQGKGDSRASIRAQGTAVEVGRTSLAPSDSSLWMQDCLAAAVGCVAELSDEGLLQLLLTSADIGLEAARISGTSNDVISGTSDSSSVALGGAPGGGAAAGGVSVGRDAEGCVRVLADALAGRMAGMSLVQLSRVVKALEAHSTSSSSSSKSSVEIRIKSLGWRLGWYSQLMQQGKAAMAAKA